MSVMSPVPSSHPLMKAWLSYQETSDFANTKQWASRSPEYAQGSLWAAFMAGWIASRDRAAALHESVNTASDQERHNGDPGAGAMGAVIEYRDLIRAETATDACDAGGAHG